MARVASTKLSISIPNDLADFAEHYQADHGLTNRSEVFALALQLLRDAELARAYSAAAAEWEASEDARLWDATAADDL